MDKPLFSTKNIDSINQKQIGVGSAKSLHQATEIDKSLQFNALLELAELKVQIEQDCNFQTKKKKFSNNDALEPIFHQTQ